MERIMSENLNDLIQQYAVEAGVLATPLIGEPAGDVLQEVLADELEVSRAPDLAEKLAHADKGDAIAEQLDVLAARADEQAAEDRDEVLAAVSVESLHREFGTIMLANGLELKAHSFESSEGAKAQAIALAKDARHVQAMTTGFADQIRDFSTEGAIMQFLRQDKARLEKARSALTAAGSKLASKKGELSKEAVIIHHDGLKRFLVVNGEPVTNAKQAIDHDIQWLHKAAGVVNKAAGEIGAALASAHGEGDHSAVVTKLQGIASGLVSGLDGHLLGNHNVSAGKASGGEKFSGKAAALAYVVGGFKAIPGAFAWALGGAAVGVLAASATGNLAVGVAAANAVGSGGGNYHTAKKMGQEYQKRTDGTDAKSVAGANDLQAIIKAVQGLGGATDFSMDAKVEEAGAKLDGAPADVKAAGKKALSAVSKLADVVYEHATYLTVKSAQLVGAAADKA